MKPHPLKVEGKSRERGGSSPDGPPTCPLSDGPSRPLLITGHATRPGRLARILRLLELVRRSWARGQRPGSSNPACCGAVPATHQPWPALRVPSGCTRRRWLTAPSKSALVTSRGSTASKEPGVRVTGVTWGLFRSPQVLCICRVSPAHSCGPLHSPQCCPGNGPHGDPGDSLSPWAGAVVTQTSVHHSETGPGRQRSPHEPFSYPVSALPEK